MQSEDVFSSKEIWPGAQGTGTMVNFSCCCAAVMIAITLFKQKKNAFTCALCKQTQANERVSENR